MKLFIFLMIIGTAISVLVSYLQKEKSGSILEKLEAQEVSLTGKLLSQFYTAQSEEMQQTKILQVYHLGALFILATMYISFFLSELEWYQTIIVVIALGVSGKFAVQWFKEILAKEKELKAHKTKIVKEVEEQKVATLKEKAAQQEGTTQEKIKIDPDAQDDDNDDAKSNGKDNANPGNKKKNNNNSGNGEAISNTMKKIAGILPAIFFAFIQFDLIFVQIGPHPCLPAKAGQAGLLREVYSSCRIEGNNEKYRSTSLHGAGIVTQTSGWIPIGLSSSSSASNEVRCRDISDRIRKEIKRNSTPLTESESASVEGLRRDAMSLKDSGRRSLLTKRRIMKNVRFESIRCRSVLPSFSPGRKKKDALRRKRQINHLY